MSTPAGHTSEPAPYDPALWRGTNLLPMPSISHSLHLAWLPLVDDGAGRPRKDAGGFYFRPHMERELDELADVGFNVLRVWGSFTGWCADRAGYLTTLREICQAMRARGMGMTYVVFNAVPAGYGTVASGRQLLAVSNWEPESLRSLLWISADFWQTAYQLGAPRNVPPGELDTTHAPEPLNAAEWKIEGRFGQWTDKRTQALVVQYVQDVGTLFAHDDDCRAVYRSYDLCNEANVLFGSPIVREHVLDWMVQMQNMLFDLHPHAQCTVGWAGGGVGRSTELTRHGGRLAYLSAHHYAGGTAVGFATTQVIIDALKAEANGLADPDLGIPPPPVIISECGVLPQDAGQWHRYLDVFQSSGIGAQLWCYLANNAWRNFPDNAEAIAVDGIEACATPALQITTGQVGQSWSRDWSSDFGGPALRFDHLHISDENAIRAWIREPTTAGAPPVTTA